MIQWFSQLNLVNKLRLLIVTTIVIALTILVTTITLIVNSNNKETILNSLQTTARLEGMSVQSIIESATNVTKDVQAYLNKTLSSYDENTELPHLFQSHGYRQYDVTVSFLQMEEYIMNTAWSAVSNDVNIESVRIFFEPYAFSNLPYYALYVDQEATQQQTVKSYSTDSYVNEEFYIQAKTTMEPYTSKPLLREDGQYVSYITYPIIANNQFLGTVTTEFLASNFKMNACSKTVLSVNDCPGTTEQIMPRSDFKIFLCVKMFIVSDWTFKES
ncbi:MAG: hypothetical protein ATN35_09505 [Epulopiscium sp. Nele67-Bin004]|nr:MAG: hypothetical protein ATN35_09505 [Epulopiscium sp. Nele67-Bin004]